MPQAISNSVALPTVCEAVPWIYDVLKLIIPIILYFYNFIIRYKFIYYAHFSTFH